ncbi:MAG: hypothetical protein K2P81_00165 [Bacteriovoracaceae bacterium]|nr:hypothetical protein [Bacteriovoracaceae bacterium]
MKWVTILLLTLTFVGCAHQFRDRKISSVEEKNEEQFQRRLSIDPRGSRY